MQLWVLQLEALLDIHTRGDISNSRYCARFCTKYFAHISQVTVSHSDLGAMHLPIL